MQYFQGVIADGAVGVDYPWSMFVTMVQTDYADIQEDYIDPSDAAIHGENLGGLTDEEANALRAQASVPVMGAIADLYRELNPAIQTTHGKGYWDFR